MVTEEDDDSDTNSSVEMGQTLEEGTLNTNLVRICCYVAIVIIAF